MSMGNILLQLLGDCKELSTWKCEQEYEAGMLGNSNSRNQDGGSRRKRLS